MSKKWYSISERAKKAKNILRHGFLGSLRFEKLEILHTLFLQQTEKKIDTRWSQFLELLHNEFPHYIASLLASVFITYYTHTVPSFRYIRIVRASFEPLVPLIINCLSIDFELPQL